MVADRKKIKMDFNKNGKNNQPLAIYPINNKFLLGVYQGKLSKFDMLLRYRQKIECLDKNRKKCYEWSRLRTPKHIHWTVDILIKMHQDKKTVKSFLTFLIEKWNETQPHKSESERKELLKIESLLPITENEAYAFAKLNTFGEYNIKFLILLAKLLMQQEKNNMAKAYMFRNLLDTLIKGEDIFKIVSSATHSGKKRK